MSGRRAELLDLPGPFYDLQAVNEVAEAFPQINAEATRTPTGIQLRLEVRAEDAQLVPAYLNALLGARATRGIPR